MKNPKIFVKIQVQGHLYYKEIWGELLSTTTSVENYGDEVANYMQVPALFIKTEDSILLVKFEKYKTFETKLITEYEYNEYLEQKYLDSQKEEKLIKRLRGNIWPIKKDDIK